MSREQTRRSGEPSNGMFLPYTLAQVLRCQDGGRFGAAHSDRVNPPPLTPGGKSPDSSTGAGGLRAWSSGLATPRGWPVVLARLPPKSVSVLLDTF